MDLSVDQPVNATSEGLPTLPLVILKRGHATISYGEQDSDGESHAPDSYLSPGCLFRDGQGESQRGTDMPRDETVVSLAEIERRILTVRRQKVMLDSDLARLYGVPTKRLNEQVRRNLGRFPPDFMFQLSAEEASAVRSQIATSKPGRGGRRYPPYAFTEHGAIMLANVLNILHTSASPKGT